MQEAYRQGDVILVRLEQPPKGIAPGRIVLAEGEATGHAHVVNGRAHLDRRNGDRILIVEEESALTHEEHGPITLPPGAYEIRQQREYRPEGWREIGD